jgi:hypothetical protein
MLSTSDLLNLIRLNEIDLQQTYLDLESEDEETRNKAGEIVLQTEELAMKLKQLYEAMSPDYSIYPKYDDYLKIITPGRGE